AGADPGDPCVHQAAVSAARRLLLRRRAGSGVRRARARQQEARRAHLRRPDRALPARHPGPGAGAADHLPDRRLHRRPAAFPQAHGDARGRARRLPAMHQGPQAGRREILAAPALEIDFLLAFPERRRGPPFCIWGATMSHIMNTYARQPVAFVRGEGVWLWDEAGKKYLDALAGIAVNTLGYAHPRLTRALSEQIGRLMHSSNLFRIPLQEAAADRLAEITGLDEVFFCNSGLEANEAAIKIARK